MEKQLSEEEVAAILAQAVRIEAKAQSGEKAGMGYDELLSIAREAGISKESLDLALANPTMTQRGWLGLSEEMSCTFGEVLTDGQRAEFFDQLGEIGKVQNVQALGNTTSVRLSKGFQFNTISVSTTGGRTRFRIKQTPFITYFVFLHAPLILAFVMTVVGFATGTLVPAFCAIMLLLAAIGLFVRTSMSAVVQFRLVAEELRSVLTDMLERPKTPIERAQPTAEGQSTSEADNPIRNRFGASP
ncbi:MAG: hypothetical protein P4L46_24635 [Fimbriimonas sp.]|nr:hypothetical protein [Fimbriimonas sp.]